MAERIAIPDEMRYRLLKLVEENPGLTQREAAEAMGMSLGKVNYCLQAVVRKGWVKVKNFTHSSRKAGYIYLLTPKGIEEKLEVTVRFLDRKQHEYEALTEELRVLTAEVDAIHNANGAAAPALVAEPTTSPEVKQ
jgi:EPS-associated MarR family transcriptional regulator